MADPFEVRMRFSQQLQHLSASVASSQKVAHYALKYRDMDEDLHSCILEQLERNNMNNRANIMYFIEHLCETATRENHLEFVRMIQRDILRIVDGVAPADGSGAANIKHVRRVLTGLQAKSILSGDTVKEIDQCLKERETVPAHLLELEDGDGNGDGDGDISKESSRRAGGAGTTTGTGLKLDKRQIEQRIEEDRERNKRLRESMWEVPGNDYDEFNKMWDEMSDIGEDDYINAEEEARERRRIAEDFELVA